jgi:hypothetical protein
MYIPMAACVVPQILAAKDVISIAIYSRSKYRASKAYTALAQPNR